MQSQQGRLSPLGTGIHRNRVSPTGLYRVLSSPEKAFTTSPRQAVFTACPPLHRSPQHSIRPACRHSLHYPVIRPAFTALSQASHHCNSTSSGRPSPQLHLPGAGLHSSCTSPGPAFTAAPTPARAGRPARCSAGGGGRRRRARRPGPAAAAARPAAAPSLATPPGWWAPVAASETSSGPAWRSRLPEGEGASAAGAG